jgi:hypothetical protein
MLENGRDTISVPVKLTPQMDAETLIIRLIRSVYGDQFVDAELGGDDGIIERFGLFEAEFIEGMRNLKLNLTLFLIICPDDDDNMSLQQLLQPSTTTNGEYSAGGRRPSTRPNNTRRCLRVLAMDECPLFILNNWQFYRPRLGSRRPSGRRGGSVSASSSTPADEDEYSQQRQRSGLHFCIQEMGDSDRALAFREPDSIQYFSSLVAKYCSLPDEKLQKRLAILDREESRAYEEAEERYERQKAWLRQQLASKNG